MVANSENRRTGENNYNPNLQRDDCKRQRERYVQPHSGMKEGKKGQNGVSM
jgi:hypothetical protein